MKKNILVTTLAVIFFVLTLFPADASAQMRRRPGAFMAREDFLELTQEQKEQLKKLRKARVEARQELMEKMRDLRQNLKGLMDDPKASEKKIEGIIDEMAKLRASFMKSSLQHRNKVRKVFTPEQLEKLEKAKKSFQGMRGQWPMGAFRQGRFFRARGFFPHRGFCCPWIRGW